MSNDFDIESLSKTWQSQEATKQFDETEFKKRFLIKRLSLLAITLVEVAILLVVGWLLIKAFSQSWAIHLKLGLIFACVAGGLAFVVVAKSRIKSLRMITSSTTDWLKFEQQMSCEALQRGKYTNYLIATFSVALCMVFTYELFVLNNLLSDLVLRYAFGVVWLFFAWLINRHHMQKHTRYLLTLK